MEVREIVGESGLLGHIVSTVWRADRETLCILLDNPTSGRWLVITLNAPGEIAEAESAPIREAS